MDFFEHQDRARRRTSLLIGYFILAVILIILAVYGVFVVVLMWLAKAPEARPHGTAAWWNPELFLWVVAGTVLVVAVGTLYKIMALSRGGEAVALMLGARPVLPATRNAAERRLLNIVEEMAIASGIPVPRIFLLEGEPGINAFAAGFSPATAVIGVTNGCMTLLTRDELQGVIAHEFSHILNGDMRLNLRLMGVLNGILVIALIGYMIFRVMSVGGKKKGAVALILLLGLGLMIIGYIGVFFARLIKSAVSRQREFLADAASVQFTRNPEGLGGALKKIGGFFSGSHIDHPKAEEASHLFFANGLRSSFFDLMATHPPLKERIRRILPDFDGEIPELSAATVRESLWNQSDAAALTAQPPPPFRVQARTPVIFHAKAVTKSVGRPQAEHLAYVSSMLTAMPSAAQSVARDPAGARALIYGLLLSRDADLRTRQLAHLEQHSEPEVYQATAESHLLLDSLAPEMRLPLVDLALATLRSLSKLQYAEFKKNLDFLIQSDDKITLFEYALQRTVVRRLDSVFNPSHTALVEYYDIQPLLSAVSVLLSTLAYYGHPDAGSAEAFQLGAAELRRNLTILPKNQCGLEPADRALALLNTASPQIKKMVLDACAACVAADNRITVTEAELLRAIADALGCPVPPILPGTMAPPN